MIKSHKYSYISNVLLIYSVIFSHINLLLNEFLIVKENNLKRIIKSYAHTFYVLLIYSIIINSNNLLLNKILVVDGIKGLYFINKFEINSSPRRSARALIQTMND